MLDQAWKPTTAHSRMRLRLLPSFAPLPSEFFFRIISVMSTKQEALTSTLNPIALFLQFTFPTRALSDKANQLLT